MYVRPVKRICDVRGCKNKDCFSISRVREAGNTPVICKSCLGMALSALDEPEVVKAKEKKPIPKLFYNSAAFPEAPAEEEKPKAEETEAEQEADGEINPSDEGGEGVKVVPDENAENLAAPSETPAEEEKSKSKRKSAKKGDK